MKHHIKPLLVIILSLSALAGGVYYVVASTAVCCRSDPGTTITIDAHGVAKNVENTGTKSYLVPHSSEAEWTRFRNAAPGLENIALSDSSAPYCSDISYDVNLVDSSGDAGGYSSIALDSNGYIHISYYDYGNSDLKYCTNAGGSWDCMVPDDGYGGIGYTGIGTSIAVDSNDKIHISHIDNIYQEDLRYCTNAGGSWNCEVAENSNLDYPEWTSIAVDSGNWPHICFTDPNWAPALSYCRKTTTGWACSGHIEDSSGYCSIAIDSNDYVHISHTDINQGLRYCDNTSGTFVCTDVPSSGGMYSSITLDSAQNVHISYYSNGDLIYCTDKSGGSLGCTTAEDSGSDIVGLYSSIVSDSADNIKISHYDYTNQDLRLCDNAGGSWICEKISDVDGNYLGRPAGRALAAKKGRLSAFPGTYSEEIYGSLYTGTDLYYSTWRACDDGNPCTDDACVDGSCSYVNDDANNCSSCPSGICECSGGACVDTEGTWVRIAWGCGAGAGCNQETGSTNLDGLPCTNIGECRYAIQYMCSASVPYNYVWECQE